MKPAFRKPPVIEFMSANGFRGYLWKRSDTMVGFGPQELALFFFLFWGLIICGIIIFFKKLFENSRRLKNIESILVKMEKERQAGEKNNGSTRE
jgi:hypothetical protein